MFGDALACAMLSRTPRADQAEAGSELTGRRQTNPGASENAIEEVERRRGKPFTHRLIDPIIKLTGVAIARVVIVVEQAKASGERDVRKHFADFQDMLVRVRVVDEDESEPRSRFWANSWQNSVASPQWTSTNSSNW